MPSDRAQRGLELEKGLFVILRPEDLAAAEPPASRLIEVTRFVPKDAIDVGYYERPYLLGPDEGSAASYFALAEALRASGRRGIARWVMRRKRYFGALEARGPYLSLVSLRTADEVVPEDRLERPQGGGVSDAERRLAEQLVAALDAPFDPTMLRDDYRERVLALIEAKAAGRRYVVSEPPPPAAAPDLTAALRESLRAAKGERAA